MSYGQSRFWFLHHYVSDPKAFNIACMFKLTGQLQIPALKNAVRSLARRHESLRTRYFWSDDGARAPTQGLISEPLMRLKISHLTSYDQFNKEYVSMRDHHWDLNSWIPVRMRLLILPNSTYYLLTETHHITLDGHSFNVLFMDLDALYSNRLLFTPSSVSQ